MDDEKSHVTQLMEETSLLSLPFSPLEVLHNKNALFQGKVRKYRLSFSFLTFPT